MLQSSTRLGHPCLTWKKGSSTFTAFPTCGARLAEWTFDHQPILRWPDPADLENIAKVRGGNPILFPFAGRSHVDGAAGRWKTPDGRILQMPQHGFVRSGTTRVTEQTDEGFAAEWIPDEIAQAAYPYPHRFAIDYRFDSHRLKVRMILENRGTTPIPWAPGHHFYFGLPFTPSSQRGDWFLSHQATAAWRHRDDGGLTPEPSISPLCFDDRSISNRILAGTGLNPITIHSPKASFAIEITATSDTPADCCTVLWTESDSAPFYCIEPWYGLPNGTGDGTRRPLVPPQTTATFTVSITLTPPHH